MQRRHKKCPLPRRWLFTDERMTDTDLFAALAALPYGSGIVFRHYGLDRASRRALFERVARVTRRRKLILLLAGGAMGVRPNAIDGVHRPEWMARRARLPRPALLSVSAHGAPGLIAARHARADIVFLSPVFATRSHPGARALGPLRFGLIAKTAQMPVMALGGMDESRFGRLKPLGAHGWAAIDALTGNRAGKEISKNESGRKKPIRI